MGLGYLGGSTEAPLRLTQEPLPARFNWAGTQRGAAACASPNYPHRDLIGFGIGVVAAFLALGELHHPLRILKRILDGLLQYPVEAGLLAGGVILALLTLGVLVYLPLRGLVFPKKIDGVLEKCSFNEGKPERHLVAIRVSGEVYRLRFNQEALHVLRS